MSKLKYVLILEDNELRIQQFEEVVEKLNPDLKVKIWQDANSMIQEVDQFLGDACLISLDHDLAPNDPKTGMDIAKFLAQKTPSCPVIVHSSNVAASWSMVNELLSAHWQVIRSGPVEMGEEWIATTWLTAARQHILS